MSTTMAGCNIIINYLPADANEEEVRDLFEAFGKVTSVRLIRNKETGQSLCYGFVIMTSETEAQMAIDSLNHKMLRDKVMKVARAKTKEEVLAGGDNTNLYITNVCPEVNSDILTRAFSKYGPIVSTHIVKNRDPSQKGVAFVKFFEKEDAERAIKEQNNKVMCIRSCHDRCICNETVGVKFAIPSSAKLQKAAAAGVVPALVPGMIPGMIPSAMPGVIPGLRPGMPGYGPASINVISALPPANGPLANTTMPNYGYAAGHLQSFITPSTINSYFAPMAGYQYSYPYQYPYGYNSTATTAAGNTGTQTSNPQYNTAQSGYPNYTTASGNQYQVPYSTPGYANSTYPSGYNSQNYNATAYNGSAPSYQPSQPYQNQYQAMPVPIPLPTTPTGLDAATNLALGTHCVFVYGLAQATTEEELQALFLPYGAISNARLCYEITDGKRTCKGYGFVNYYSYNDAQLAIAGLNNYNYKGHVLQVRLKSSKGGKG